MKINSHIHASLQITCAHITRRPYNRKRNRNLKNSDNIQRVLSLRLNLNQKTRIYPPTNAFAKRLRSPLTLKNNLTQQLFQQTTRALCMMIIHMWCIHSPHMDMWMRLACNTWYLLFWHMWWTWRWVGHWRGICVALCYILYSAV